MMKSARILKQEKKPIENDRGDEKIYNCCVPADAVERSGTNGGAAAR